MKNKNSTYQMWFLPIVFLCVYVFYIWMLVYSFHEFPSFSPYLIILIIILTSITTYSLVYSIIFGLTMIEFSDISIKKSFFGICLIKEFFWGEIVDVRKVYIAGSPNVWICFSKIPLSNMRYNQIIKNKNVIRVINNSKNREIIKRFYFRDIK